MEITQERMEKSLKYLIETDEPCALSKSLLEGYKEQKKTVFALEFLKQGGTGQEREAKANSSEAFTDWQVKYKESVYEFETMRNKRITETLVVECWRSLNSNRRQAGGNL